MASTASIPEPVELSISPTLLFRVGESLYGCDIRDTQEIIPLRSMTRLPGAPAYVRGLINVRGVIVTVLDLATRLNAVSSRTSEEGSILLVRHRERLVGAMVDAVSDVRVLEIDADGAPSQGGGGVVRGVATVDGAAVVVLDLDALIQQVLLS
ncbi:MAG TPA: chemotaxis protein CheW [Gemmatimonadaceae bacterium]|nr:chemotaxis protein CheW [Gemmatimonadaceae bacterium]